MPKPRNRNIDKQVQDLVNREQWKALAHIWWGLSNKKNKWRDRERLENSVKMFFTTNFRVKLSDLYVRWIANQCLRMRNTPMLDKDIVQDKTEQPEADRVEDWVDDMWDARLER